MVEPHHAGDIEPDRAPSVLRRLGTGAIFIVGILLPGMVVLFGVLSLALSPFGDTPVARRDTLVGGIFLIVLGGAFLTPGTLFFLRRRRRRSLTPYKREAVASGTQSLNTVIGPPVVPPPTSVILPFSLQSRPWNSSPWWLAPIVLFAITASRLFPRHGVSGPLLAFAAGSAAVSILVGVLQYLYFYRRRIVIDDLNVSYADMLGRTRSIARGEVRRIALRTWIRRAGTQDRMFFIGLNGECILRVARFGLGYEEASQLAAILQVPIDPSWDRPITIKGLQTEFAGGASWAERHTVLNTVAVMIPILAWALGLTLATNGR